MDHINICSFSQLDHSLYSWPVLTIPQGWWTYSFLRNISSWFPEFTGLQLRYEYDHNFWQVKPASSNQQNQLLFQNNNKKCHLIVLKTGLLILHLVIMAAQYCQTLFMPASLFLIDIKIDDPRTIYIFLLKTDRTTARWWCCWYIFSQTFHNKISAQFWGTVVSSSLSCPTPTYGAYSYSNVSFPYAFCLIGNHISASPVSVQNKRTKHMLCIYSYGVCLATIL